MMSYAARSATKKRSGFTLVELMVVIMIIGIVSGVVLVAVDGRDEARTVNAGVAKLRSMFSLAQSAAVSRNITTRVLIHADPSDPDNTSQLDERYLRYYTIVYFDEDDSQWKPFTQGEFLPDGVYFSPALSTWRTGGTNAPKLKVWGLAFDPDTLTFSAPSSVIDATSAAFSGNRDPITNRGEGVWYMYEFRPNGTFTNPMARVVIAPGLLVNQEIVFPQESTGEEDTYENARGFVIFRSGKPMFFQDPDQMKE